MQLGEDVRTIVWLQTGFLGDIVLTTAAFRWVRQFYPSLRQLLITTPLGVKALAGHPDLDGVLSFDKRGRSLWSAARVLAKDLRSEKGAVLLQAHRSARSSLLAKFIGFPTVTYEETALSFLARWRVPRIALLHETQRILLLLEALGASRWDFQNALPQLPAPTANAWAQTLENWAGDSPLIAIAPGSVWGTKRWPQENYRSLAKLLLENPRIKLLILGSGEEIGAAACVAEASLGPERLMNLAGKTSLDDLRAIFPLLHLLISNDSSPLHYASAFRVPTLAIFGATVPGLGFGPLAPGSRIAERQLPCRPCSDHGPQICPLGHFRCMREQTPEQISQIVWEMLPVAEPYGGS